MRFCAALVGVRSGLAADAFVVRSLPVAVVVVLAMYLYWIPDRAAVFADLLESAFDIHRSLLYRSQRWPLPENPRDEHASGEQITSYLMRGMDGATPTFTSDPGDS